MPRRTGTKIMELRARVAEEAARIMREQGVRDYLLAKRKAADRLGVDDRTALPRNQEIAEALSTQQRLFGGTAHEENLRQLRETALSAMQMLAGFDPRLVGPVLDGTATPHSDVNLHLFTDAAEEVAFHLMELEIRYRPGDRRVRLASGQHASYPSFVFEHSGSTVEVTVFPTNAIRQAPACPVSGGAMKRARRDELEALLGGAAAAEGWR